MVYQVPMLISHGYLSLSEGQNCKPSSMNHLLFGTPFYPCLQHVMIRCFACFTIFMLSLCVHDLVCDIPKNWEGIGHFFVDLDHPKCIRTMSEEPLLSVIVNGKTLSACKKVQQIFLRRNNGLPDLDCDPRGFLSRFWKQETWREICCRHEESYAKFYCTFLFCLYRPLIFCGLHFVNAQHMCLEHLGTPSLGRMFPSNSQCPRLTCNHRTLPLTWTSS